MAALTPAMAALSRSLGEDGILAVPPDAPRKRNVCVADRGFDCGCGRVLARGRLGDVKQKAPPIRPSTNSNGIDSRSSLQLGAMVLLGVGVGLYFRLCLVTFGYVIYLHAICKSVLLGSALGSWIIDQCTIWIHVI